MTTPRIGQPQYTEDAAPIDQAHVAELSVDKLTTGTLEAATITVGDDGYIKAGTGAAQVLVTKDGIVGTNADEVNFRLDDQGLRLKGHIEAESGTFTGAITGGTINIGAGTFTVDEEGNLVATSATIGGRLLTSDGSPIDIGEVASAGVNANNALLAADRAQETSDASVSASAINRNPHFAVWDDDFPEGWLSFGSANPIKETTLYRSPPNAVRFNVAASGDQRGIYAFDTAPAEALQDMPLGIEYITVEIDVQLVSGTFAGAGVQLDWEGTSAGSTPLDYRATLNLNTELPDATTGRWYRISKSLRRPTPEAGWTQDRYAIYLMANATALGAGVKNIVFDRIVLRPSTVEEHILTGTYQSQLSGQRLVIETIDDAYYGNSVHALQLLPSDGVTNEFNPVIYGKNDSSFQTWEINTGQRSSSTEGARLTLDANNAYSNAHLQAKYIKLRAGTGYDVGINVPPRVLDLIELDGLVRIVQDTSANGDASETSTGHPLQIGADDTFNTIFDNNEVVARNNGALSTWGVLCTNFSITGTGTVSSQGTASNSILRKDYFDARIDHGTSTINIAALNTVYNIAVNFGQTFPGTPSVTITPVSTSAPAGLTYSISGISTTGFTLYTHKSSGATGNQIFRFIAVFS